MTRWQPAIDAMTQWRPAIDALGRWQPALLVFVAILAAGCSGIPRRERDQQQLERYLRYAKDPVDRITYLGHYDNWQSVSRYQIVLWTSINDAYLITVVSPCEDLQFAQRIGITQTGNTISARFDSVLVKHWRCQISEIRPIDYLQLKRDQRAEHDAADHAATATPAPATTPAATSIAAPAPK